MLLAKVWGPSATDVFGVDIHEIKAPTDVQTTEHGVLTITVPATPESTVNGRTKRATRGATIGYPRGGWTKVVIVDVVKDGE